MLRLSARIAGRRAGGSHTQSRKNKLTLAIWWCTLNNCRCTDQVYFVYATVEQWWTVDVGWIEIVSRTDALWQLQQYLSTRMAVAPKCFSLASQVVCLVEVISDLCWLLLALEWFFFFFMGSWHTWTGVFSEGTRQVHTESLWRNDDNEKYTGMAPASGWSWTGRNSKCCFYIMTCTCSSRWWAETWREIMIGDRKLRKAHDEQQQQQGDCGVLLLTRGGMRGI